MSGQLIRKFAFPTGSKMSIFLAQTVNDQGYHRVVEAIDPQVKEDIATKAEAALKNVHMVPSHIQAQVKSIVLT